MHGPPEAHGSFCFSSGLGPQGKTPYSRDKHCSAFFLQVVIKRLTHPWKIHGWEMIHEWWMIDGGYMDNE